MSPQEYCKQFVNESVVINVDFVAVFFQLVGNKFTKLLPCCQVKKIMKNRKAHYFRSKLENSKNPKDCWKCINELLNRKQKTTVINQLKIEEHIVTHPDKIAYEFNKYFCKTWPKLAGTIPTNNLDLFKYVKSSPSQFSF